LFRFVLTRFPDLHRLGDRFCSSAADWSVSRDIDPTSLPELIRQYIPRAKKWTLRMMTKGEINFGATHARKRKA
jgi:hypothetical protein